MRCIPLTVATVFAFTLGCGEKKPPAPSAAEVAAAQEAAAAEAAAAAAAQIAAEQAAAAAAAAAEAEAAAEAAANVVNADFDVTITYADGTSRSGHVVRVERSTDWWGEEDWTTDEGDLTLELEDLSEVTWSDIKSLGITAGKVPGDVDCSYSSDYNPWMYTCELRTPTTARTTDGKSLEVNTRNKWRMTFDDDTDVEFWLKKYPARKQDDKELAFGDVAEENFDIYTALQDQLREEVKTVLVKSITIQ